MKELITLVITIVVTMSCYSQDTMKAQAYRSCVWYNEIQNWLCLNYTRQPINIIHRNNIYYINDKHKLYYITKGEPDVSYFNGCNSIIYKNVKDSKGERCYLSIIYYPEGDKIIYISYTNRQMRYYFNPTN
jgi:hypothetical protein